MHQGTRVAGTPRIARGASASDQDAAVQSPPPDEQFQIGERLRSVREQHSLSVRKLGRMAGVSASLISEAERGLVEPSVGVLKKVASALDVTLTYFFTKPGMAGETVIRKGERRRLQELHGFTYELLGPDGIETIEPIFARLSPGAGLDDPTMMSHGSGEEWGMVLSGRLKVWVGSEVYVLESGDSVYFASSIPHRVANLSDGITEYVWVNSPATF
jgi:transcriptional regulator with XRE-family HTH domain